jgi:hypothetical protein
VVELSIVGAVDEWPVQVQHIQVLELHQMKSFFHFPLDVLATKVPYLSGDKKLLTSHTALADYCLDRSAQSNFIIVQAGSVDVAASAQLKTLPQDVSQQLGVFELVGAETLQLQQLLVGQRLNGGTALLLRLLLSHAVI